MGWTHNRLDNSLSSRPRKLDVERVAARAERAERLVELYREHGTSDLTRMVEYEYALEVRARGRTP